MKKLSILLLTIFASTSVFAQNISLDKKYYNITYIPNHKGAVAFNHAIKAGRAVYQTTPILPRKMASPPTRLVGEHCFG